MSTQKEGDSPLEQAKHLLEEQQNSYLTKGNTGAAVVMAAVLTWLVPTVSKLDSLPRQVDSLKAAVAAHEKTEGHRNGMSRVIRLEVKVQRLERIAMEQRKTRKLIDRLYSDVRVLRTLLGSIRKELRGMRRQRRRKGRR